MGVFLADICELDKMLLQSHCKGDQELENLRNRPSGNRYEEPVDFSPKALGAARISHVNTGFDLFEIPQI